MSDLRKPILLTGASGYVGGRLLRALETHGHRIRCVARKPEYLQARVGPNTEVVHGDVFDPQSLERALHGTGTAYYLVHSMGAGATFREADRQAAHAFASAAHRAGVSKLVYLGGLGSGPGLSEHLESRHEVGHIFRASPVPTIEFRASIVIGSGSLSFEMIRALVEKLPVMITPRWVRVPAQPIAVEDVIGYLVAALDTDPTGSPVFEIGGADQVSYGAIMREYARQRGLSRLMIPVPLLTPKLSSLWLGLVTPIYARIGKQLIDSLRNPTIVETDAARRTFSIEPRGVAEAITRALSNEDHSIAETRWSDALSSGGEKAPWGGTRFGSRIVDSRTMDVGVGPAQAFTPIRRIGGRVGWYYGDWLWRLRGFLDLLVGGVGVRRGRRDPEHVGPGDTLDFWRVEAVEPDRMLRLAAEMKLPGRAWLQFEVEPRAPGSTIRQTAIFDPTGLLGLAYWYALYPVHALVFRGMLKQIARAARQVVPAVDLPRNR
ncbi:MAG: SDR family oxidoreductase [Gemmatimonadota bacterium]|nr:SDR family oxidoreductase [Gemmatimonadota bacterium]